MIKNEKKFKIFHETVMMILRDFHLANCHKRVLNSQ